MGRRGFSLRGRLLILVLVGILPLLTLSLVFRYFDYREKVAATGRETLALARTASLLVQGRLRGYIDTTAAIAESAMLRGGDFDHFRARAEAIIERQFPGAMMLVLREDGQELLNTAVPSGGSLPRWPEMDALRTVFATGKPAVTPMFSPSTDRSAMAIEAPVRQADGTISYVLALSPALADFAEVVRREQLPPRWTAWVLDTTGRYVASVPENGARIGAEAPQTLLSAMQTQRDGTLESTAPDGSPVLLTFSRGAPYGWTVAIAAPRDELTKPALAALISTVGAGAGLLVISILLALYAARTIAKPITSLRRLAAATEQDPHLVPEFTGLPEADEVANALLNAERDLRRTHETETVLRHGIEAIHEGFAIYDDEDRLVLCNDSYRSLFPGRPEQVVIGAQCHDMVHGTPVHNTSPQARQSHDGAFEQRLPDGRWVLISEQRLPNGWLASLHVDVSAFKAAEEALRNSEARFRLVVESAPNAILMVNAQGAIELVNGPAERVFGYSRTELLGQPIELLVPDRIRRRHPKLRLGFFAAPQARQMGAGRELNACRKDGSEFPVEIGLSPIETETGVMVLAAVIDITARKDVERQLLAAQRETEQTVTALRTSEEQLKRAQHLARMGSFVTNLRTGEIELSDETYSILGIARVPFDAAAFLALVHPEDRDAIYHLHEQALRNLPLASCEFRIVRPDGSTRAIQSENELIRDADGEPLSLAGTLHDVTERRLIEAQLRQAQKMEAIGNLTGGMAHDFNNLLGVIIGNLEYARNRMKDDDDLVEVIDDAHSAAWHGADLTRRLLAFARRQPLRPEVLKINELISNTVRLLRRMLGEDIEVVLKLEPNLWPVMVDPAQLEATLANLATNARDAMRKGGRLIIATANRHLDASYVAANVDAHEGDNVMIEVSDTGTGMSAETISRIFEPFFTTKETGKGSGLGLSMVFGFLQQSGGHVSVYSEPGIGTTFRLYLPRALAGEAPRAASSEPDVEQGIGEIVLVVEDNAAIRRVVLRQLRALDYRTRESASAAEALDVMAREPIDLLFTDIVMPGGLDGVELARLAIERWPGIKVLLTSGFPEARVEGEYGLAGLRLLSKPYGVRALATALREALDG